MEIVHMSKFKPGTADFSVVCFDFESNVSRFFDI